nr:SprT-like domain-containing protein [uncultured Dyadobacter sp.]
MNGITKQQFNTLEDLFTYYNEALFASSLPFCLVNLSRHRNAAGFFIQGNWQAANGDKKHEISINPDILRMGDEYWHSTLIHEMVHLWQCEFGKPSRRNYHNKEWAAKMIEVGLMPTDTGQPGGKTTGQNMSDYVIRGGSFDQAFSAITKMQLSNLLLPYKSTNGYIANIENTNEAGGDEKEEKAGKSGKRIKYTCECGTNVWGKSGLELHCNSCDTDFEEQD